MTADDRPPSAAATKPSRSKGRRRRIPLADYPAWTQAIVAVLALFVSVAGVYLTARQVFDEDDPTPSPIVIRAEAFIEAVTVGTDAVAARGGFRNVDLGAEEILFIGRPEGPAAAEWLPVEADVVPGPGSSGERVDGDWEALRPFAETGPYIWQVVVVPAGSGAGGGLDDLRQHGPDSTIVITASEPFRTGD